MLLSQKRVPPMNKKKPSACQNGKQIARGSVSIPGRVNDFNLHKKKKTRSNEPAKLPMPILSFSLYGLTVIVSCQQVTAWKKWQLYVL